MQKYFEILGIPSNSSKQEIKKAYRKLAFKYHPDKNNDPDSERRFLEISEAYEMLTSPLRKKRIKRSHAEAEKRKQEEILKAKQKAKENLRKRYNEFKKQEEKEQSRQYLFGIYIFVSIVFLLIISYTSYYAWFEAQAYTNSDTVLGQVIYVDYRSYDIKFMANNKSHSLNKNGDRTFEDLCGKNGMPIEVGEEFLVVYNKENPKYFDVLFEPVTRQTFKIYQQITKNKITNWLAENNYKTDDYRADCMFVNIYNTYGIDGLAQMYFYNEPLIENTDNNAWTFESFKNQQSFKDIVSNCQK